MIKHTFAQSPLVRVSLERQSWLAVLDVGSVSAALVFAISMTAGSGMMRPDFSGAKIVLSRCRKHLLTFFVNFRWPDPQLGLRHW